MVRRGTVWCGVAQLWCSVRGTLWCSMAQYGAAWHILWCSVAQLVARRLAGRQTRVRFLARHHREVCPTELTGDEEMERGLGECII